MDSWLNLIPPSPGKSDLSRSDIWRGDQRSASLERT